MKRIALSVLLVLGLLALTGLVITINVKEVALKSKENLAFQYISDIKNTSQNLNYLSQNGIILENTSKQAKVTPSQAVEIASKVVPLSPGEKAKKIVVEYCQIKDSQFVNSDNTPSIDTSCYLVSFQGVARYTKCNPPPGSPLVPVGYEYNIIVDANSGKFLGEIDYR